MFCKGFASVYISVTVISEAEHQGEVTCVCPPAHTHKTFKVKCLENAVLNSLLLGGCERSYKFQDALMSIKKQSHWAKSCD